MQRVIRQIMDEGFDLSTAQKIHQLAIDSRSDPLQLAIEIKRHVNREAADGNEIRRADGSTSTGTGGQDEAD